MLSKHNQGLERIPMLHSRSELRGILESLLQTFFSSGNRL